MLPIIKCRCHCVQARWKNTAISVLEYFYHDNYYEDQQTLYVWLQNVVYVDAQTFGGNLFSQISYHQHITHKSSLGMRLYILIMVTCPALFGHVSFQ